MKKADGLNLGAQSNSGLVDDFGERITFVVKKIGGLKAASALTGKSVRQIQRYIKGDDVPVSFLATLSGAAGVRLEWLAGGHETPDENQNHAVSGLNPDAVFNAVEALKGWLNKKGRDMKPEEMAAAVILLTGAADQEGNIAPDFIDRLMKFKGHLPENQ